MNDKIINKINRLRDERNAVILAHNYQIPEIQDIADYVGDSLGLSQIASKTEADVIVFCGVHFMAETAKILSPDKRVIMPDVNSGCPMANMINARQLKNLKTSYPDAVVVCYVNSTAEVKAEVDYCCTSANAPKVIEAIEKDRQIIFVPDKYLGAWTAKQTGREMILWEGFCPTHRRILPENFVEMRAKHPNAVVIAHPECVPEVTDMADYVRSTSGMLKVPGEVDAKEFIIATEIGMLHPLRKAHPDRIFYPASELADCPNMKLNSLEKLLWVLEDMQPEITVPDEIRIRALKSIERMVSIT
ncbi:MAG: quinolinate synthase NadA [candidate division Zixibacteria bacterium]|nr:quinolinate synthase NadA [candidate division Zixibacteria bacterium]